MAGGFRPGPLRGHREAPPATSAVTRPGAEAAPAAPIPPPGAVLLSVGGLRGAQDHAAVLEALRVRDPSAHVWTDWPRGLVAVQSDHPPEALRLAVRQAGFPTTWLPHPPLQVGAGGAGAAILRVIGFGFVGLVLGTLAGAAAGIAHVALDPACNGPDDSAGCAIGIPAIALGTGLLGAAVGAVIALVRAARGR